MKEKLLHLLEHAYSPYYHFPVASIAIMKDGKEFSGVNVENANGTSICAERNAIATAIAAGYHRGDFDQIYVMLSNGEHGWPCFACRQVILEFLEPDQSIISMKQDGSTQQHTVAELCPYGFGKEDLDGQE